MLRIGDVAEPICRPEQPVPGRSYRQVGVRLWGQGAYEREPLDGGATQYSLLCRVEAGDIIVNKIWARNGSVSVICPELDGCWCSGEFPLWRPIKSLLDPRWFFWITKTSWFWNACNVASRGTTGKRRIRPEAFANIRIPVPDASIQEMLIKRLEGLTGKLEKARRLSDEVLHEAGALLVSMAHRADLSEVQKDQLGWRKLCTADIVKLVSDNVIVKPDCDYPNFGIYSYGRGLFSKPPILGLETSATSLRRVRAGQFIYSRLFAWEGAFGVVPPEFDGWYVSNEYPTFDCDKEQVLPEFLLAYFRAPHVWQAVSVGSKGLGSRRVRVQPDQVLKHVLWLPPMAQQQQLAAVLRRLGGAQPFAELERELAALLPSYLAKQLTPNTRVLPAAVE